MTPIARSSCPDFLLPYLVDVPAVEFLTREHVENFLRNRSGLPPSISGLHKSLRSLLSETFLSRCCYCEAYADTSNGVIERFRPKGGRQGEAPYWHLQADWRNLYWSCPVCNRYKADRFPIEGEPVIGGSYLDTIHGERSLLIDPCRDDPDEHLVFLEDGTVLGNTSTGDQTIKLLDLNRQQLVVSRLDQIKLLYQSSDEDRATATDPGRSHPAVWRQLGSTFSSHVRPLFPPNLVKVSSSDNSRLKVEPHKSSAIDTETGDGLEAYRIQAQYITRIKIKNFGPIHHLDLDLSLSLSPQAPCFALLGENGVGKSTVLRALALTLSGKDYVRSLGITSNKILADGAYEGAVQASLVGGEDIIMSFKRNRPITFSADHSRSLVLAYGATRLLPRGRHKPKPGRAHAKIDNLFDPFLPITDPEKWLREIDLERLEEVNHILTNLMPQDHQVRVVQCEEQGVLLEVGGVGGRKIKELSDGYQSMLGMAVDIMKVLSRSGAPIESAEGVVMIDELGNHFHPAWRLQCLNAMRTAFPRAQLIYSTHDPLCLRGLYEGEVAVLRRDKLGHIYALEDLPAVSRLRVEQLLSSEHFGLRSTVDPQMEEDIKQYEALLEMPSRTEEENELLDEVVQRLTDMRYLGASRRERLALQLLDSSGMEEVPAQPRVSAHQLSAKTVSRLRFVMKQVSPRAASIEEDGNDQG